MQSLPVLINFPIFLKKHKDNINDKFGLIIKYYLLDSSIRSYKMNIHLEDVVKLPKYKNLFNNLNYALMNLNEFKRPALIVNK